MRLSRRWAYRCSPEAANLRSKNSAVTRLARTLGKYEVRSKKYESCNHLEARVFRADREVGAQFCSSHRARDSSIHLTTTRLLVSGRSRPECACASEVTLASLPRTHLCRCIRSHAPGSSGAALQV